MSLFQKNIDQRKSFRCSVPKSQQEARLRVGRRRVVVRLFNESCGGFAALTDEDLHVAIGDVLTLTTSFGQYQVRVAHIALIEPVPSEGESAGALFRLGLERLGELTAGSAGGPAAAGLLSGNLWRSLAPSSSLLIGVATVFGVAMIVAVVVMLANAHSPLVRKLAGPDQHGGRPTQKPAAAFAQAVKEVGLTRQQEAQIQDIAHQTVHTLQTVDTLWKSDPPNVRIRKQALLLEVAKREILELLSEEQRARWKALLECDVTPAGK